VSLAEEAQARVFGAEDFIGGGAEPLVEDGGVDGAEIGGEGEVGVFGDF